MQEETQETKREKLTREIPGEDQHEQGCTANKRTNFGYKDCR